MPDRRPTFDARDFLVVAVTAPLIGAVAGWLATLLVAGAFVKLPLVNAVSFFAISVLTHVVQHQRKVLQYRRSLGGVRRPKDMLDSSTIRASTDAQRGEPLDADSSGAPERTDGYTPLLEAEAVDGVAAIDQTESSEGMGASTDE